MTQELEDLFKDADYCGQEICRIRQAIGTRGATRKVFQAASDTLAAMYIHGPKHMQTTILSQLEELIRREAYAAALPGFND